MRPVYRTLVAGALSLVSIGCPGKPAGPPKREDYNSDIVTIQTSTWGRVFLIDVDRDGQIDYIHDDRNYFMWASQEYKKKNALDSAKEMPPEMRDAASAVLRFQNDLDFQIAKSRYESK